MRKFKIGDKVRCVENGTASKPNALGYKPGKEFVVDSGSKSSGGEYIYFPKDGLGVYECDLVLVKELPKSFACRNTNKELWDKYIKWLNKEYNSDFFGKSSYCPYYGISINGEVDNYSSKHDFDIILSLEEWDEIVNPKSKQLPKSFGCTNTNQKLWDKYIKWLNKEHNGGFNGSQFKYYGIERNGCKYCCDSKDLYDTILSLEEWDEIVNGTETKKEETMKNYTITREQLQKIYDVACSDWKETILKYSRRNPFGTTIEFTQEEVVAMFVASSLSQRAVLEGIFGKQIKELDFQSDNINFEVDGISVFGISNMKSDESFIGLPRANHPNSFFLNPDYVWTLDGDVLTVTRKNK